MRHSTEGPGNSRYLLEAGNGFPGGVVVASECLDRDVGWWEVPDRHLLTADVKRGATLRPLLS